MAVWFFLYFQSLAHAFKIAENKVKHIADRNKIKVTKGVKKVMILLCDFDMIFNFCNCISYSLK